MRFVLVVIFLVFSVASYSSDMNEIIVSPTERLIIKKLDNGVNCLISSAQSEMFVKGCIADTRPSFMLGMHDKMNLAASLVKPEPKRALILGLSTGQFSTIADTMANYVEVVEPSSAYQLAAEHYFDFKPASNMKVYSVSIEDFIVSAVDSGVQYDWIIFDGVSVSQNLALFSEATFNRLSRLMSDDGVLIIKSENNEDIYKTLSSVFSDVYFFFDEKALIRGAVSSMNPISIESVRNNALSQAGLFLKEYGVNVNDILSALDNQPFWSDGAKIINDSYLSDSVDNNNVELAFILRFIFERYKSEVIFSGIVLLFFFGLGVIKFFEFFKRDAN